MFSKESTHERESTEPMTPYTKFSQLQKELFEVSPEQQIISTPVKVDIKPMRQFFEPLTSASSDPFFESENRKYFTVKGKKYLQLSQIGKGGSSLVYKVIDSKFNQYALKNVVVDKEMLTMLLEEIKLLQALRLEERIINLDDFEIIKSDCTIFMILELGQMDLDQLIKLHIQKGGLEMCYIRVYWKEMLEAVKVVHKHRIVHSDLKPANFILVSGHLKLSDFGIAKKIENDTTHIERENGIGTLSYMAPEAIVVNKTTQMTYKQGRPSDIWSLGCILYQMIYGQSPFQHLNMYQKIQVIPDTNHPIPYAETRHLAKQTMQWCLQRDPNHRATVEQLLGHAFICE